MKKMKDKIKDIFFCLNTGFVSTFIPSVFLWVIANELLKGFSINNQIVISLSFISASLYLAWISGVMVSDRVKFNVYLRSFFSSAFLNILLFIKLINYSVNSGKAHILFLLVLTNYLCAKY